MPTDSAMAIVNAFTKYCSSGDRSLINRYGRKEITDALYQYHADQGWVHYKAMQDRIDELDKTETQKKFRRSKWIDRLIGAIVAVLVMVIGKWILFKLGISD